MGISTASRSTINLASHYISTRGVGSSFTIHYTLNVVKSPPPRPPPQWLPHLNDSILKPGEKPISFYCHFLGDSPSNSYSMPSPPPSSLSPRRVFSVFSCGIAHPTGWWWHTTAWRQQLRAEERTCEAIATANERRIGQPSRGTFLLGFFRGRGRGQEPRKSHVSILFPLPSDERHRFVKVISSSKTVAASLREAVCSADVM